MSRVLSPTLRHEIVYRQNETLFKGIEVKRARDIVAVYDNSLTHEAQLFLAHLHLYLETRFGDAIWDWLTKYIQEQ